LAKNLRRSKDLNGRDLPPFKKTGYGDNQWPGIFNLNYQHIRNALNVRHGALNCLVDGSLNLLKCR